MPTVTRLKPNTKKKKQVTKSEEDIWDSIEDISEPTTGITINLYGRSGCGKTRLACTFPKPLLLIRAEDGTRSVYKTKGVKVTKKLTSSSELTTICQRQHEEQTFKTLVLDTASVFQDLVLKEIIGDVPIQVGFGEITMENYQERALIVKERLNELLELANDGTHIVIIAQERDFEPEDLVDTNIITPNVQSSLGKSIVEWLNPKVDFIAHLYVREQEVKRNVKVGKKTVTKTSVENQFCLRTKTHPVYRCKFRIPDDRVMPECIVNPHFDKVLELIT